MILRKLSRSLYLKPGFSGPRWHNWWSISFPAQCREQGAGGQAARLRRAKRLAHSEPIHRGLSYLPRLVCCQLRGNAGAVGSRGGFQPWKRLFSGYSGHRCVLFFFYCLLVFLSPRKEAHTLPPLRSTFLWGQFPPPRPRRELALAGVTVQIVGQRL